ncbi:hypothetical protein [Stenotrophomonas sp. AG209]|uniref:GFA family protein n=1 Tax=Stenotrophomonas sp. AG209 TaxID=2183909 RepID=UPI000E5A5F0B|nr:hypothetical protein [Stenotrophomonas sp. AG209]HDS1828044.1 hypothetical protein [Stenotrophomonas maltophilia]
MQMPSHQSLACACGQVRLAITCRPIASVECCCDSCRRAGTQLQSMPGAPQVLGPQGQTHFVMQRKDRVRIEAGQSLLHAFRLSSRGGSRRVLAGCCNTPLFLEFSGGHWLSLYGLLWPASERPAVEMRTMVSDLPDPSALPDDVPNLKTRSLRFYARLMKAWIAMGFRSPRIDVAGDAHG